MLCALMGATHTHFLFWSKKATCAKWQRAASVVADGLRTVGPCNKTAFPFFHMA